MTGRTHAIVGTAAALCVATVTQQPLQITLAFGMVGFISGLAPDLDHPQSMLSGWLPFTGFLRLFVSHRGLTHTLAFWMAIYGILWALLPQFHLVILASALAVLSHLVADMLTPWGVPLLRPVSNFNFTLLPALFLKLTSWIIEMAVMLSSVVLIGLLLVRHL